MNSAIRLTEDSISRVKYYSDDTNEVADTSGAAALHNGRRHHYTACRFPLGNLT